MHGGSGNHGCEALVRTIMAILPQNAEIKLFSKKPQEDYKYIGKDIDVIECGNLRGNFWNLLITKIRIKLLKQKYAFVKTAYRSLINYADKNTVAISIGGDNYCYDGMPEVLAILNKKLKRKGAKTVLLGCSIEPDLIRNKRIAKDLSRYDLITARESITYNALKEECIQTKIILIPDSAFILPTEEVQKFDKETVGLNISPLILSCEGEVPILFNSYCKLIEYILKTTDMQIALIPHVVWGGNNDNIPISQLYDLYKDTGRIIKVEDANAPTLKGYIKNCKYFVGARTHSTIAAYSNYVPTLVVGYSVKSKGIAKDIFGNYNDYVLDVRNIKDENDLVVWLEKILKNEKDMIEKLKDYTTKSVEKIGELTKLLEDLI